MAALEALGLESCGHERPVIVVGGGAAGMGAAALRRTMAVLGPAVVTAAECVATGVPSAGGRSDHAAALAVVGGGTDAGVMAAIGRARAQRGSALPVLLGVAPRGKVTWPDGPADGQAALEPNHSHFILAEAADWGGETGLLIEVAASLACGRVIMVVAGGGKTARAEVLAAVRQGWKVFVIAGTGGVAQMIARARRSCPGRKRRDRGLGQGAGSLSRPGWPELGADETAELDEIVRDGDIEVFIGDDPHQLGYRLAWELRDEPVLKEAWRICATYDRLAVRERAFFQRVQAAIIALGLAATLLALIQYENHGREGHIVLHWLVVIVPILVSVLIASSAGRSDGTRWITLRAAAEEAKTEIYRYRTRTEAYRDQQSHHRHWTSLVVRGVPAVLGDRTGVTGDRGGPRFRRLQTRMLQAHLSRVNDQVVKTHAAMGSLAPYAGPFPPQSAGSTDDGLSPLDAQSYLRIRVQDQIGYFHRRIRYLNQLRTMLELAAIAAGGTGAILASLGHDVWIALTSGIAGAALTYRGYWQAENNIVTYNRAASRLADLDRWWHTLSPSEQTSKALGYLVTTVEMVLARERTGWVAQMSETVKYLQAQGSGDVGADQ